MEEDCNCPGDEQKRKHKKALENPKEYKQEAMRKQKESIGKHYKKPLGNQWKTRGTP